VEGPPVWQGHYTPKPKQARKSPTPCTIVIKSFLKTKRINGKQIPGVTFSGGFFGLDPSKHDFWDNTLDQDEEINDGELTGTWLADGTIILLNPKEPF
jgi:hypothetical protein